MPTQTRMEDLKQLTDREIQVLLRETDQKDFVVGFKDVSKALRAKFLGNMSKRVRTFITEEMEFLGEMNPGEVMEVQGRIIKQALRLAEQGQISWPGDSKKTGSGPKAKKPSKKYLAEKEALKKQASRCLQGMDNEEIDALFVGLAEVARREGILALEEFAAQMTDPYMKMAFQLAVDGTEPDLIMDVMESWRDSRVHEFVVKNNKVIEGVMAIQSGDNPRIIEVKMSRIY